MQAMVLYVFRRRIGGDRGEPWWRTVDFLYAAIVPLRVRLSLYVACVCLG